RWMVLFIWLPERMRSLILRRDNQARAGRGPTKGIGRGPRMGLNHPDYEREVRIPSDTREAFRFQNELVDELERLEFSCEARNAIRLALEEALVNAVKHGNQLDPEKQVHVRYTLNTTEFAIEIRDEGQGFEPEEVPDPTAPEFLERPCGRGLLL